MGWLIGLAVYWVLSVPVTYLAIRAGFLRAGHRWTVGDRRLAMFLAVGFGYIVAPITVAMLLFGGGDDKAISKW